MITLIQLKQVARNRRFLLFTILFPALWYLMMAKLLNFPRASTNYQLVLLVLAILIGILGNSIVTFSKRISSNRRFYFLQARISQYSIWDYMGAQLITQLILNLVITIILVVLACLLQAIHFSHVAWLSFVLVNVFGIYLSVIGFVCGIAFDRTAIDAGSTPLMFLLATFIVPWKVFLPANTMIDLMTAVQKIFPSYYAYQMVQQDGQLWKNIGMFAISFALTLVPFLLAIAVKLRQH